MASRQHLSDLASMPPIYFTAKRAKAAKKIRGSVSSPPSDRTILSISYHTAKNIEDAKKMLRPLRSSRSLRLGNWRTGNRV